MNSFAGHCCACSIGPCAHTFPPTFCNDCLGSRYIATGPKTDVNPDRLSQIEEWIAEVKRDLPYLFEKEKKILHLCEELLEARKELKELKECGFRSMNSDEAKAHNKAIMSFFTNEPTNTASTYPEDVSMKSENKDISKGQSMCIHGDAEPMTCKYCRDEPAKGEK